MQLEMEEMMAKKKKSQAQKTLDALQALEEWYKSRPVEWFRFIERDTTSPSFRDVRDVLDVLRQELLLETYRTLDNEAIEQARTWHYHNFAGFTRDSKDIAVMTRDQLLRSMAVHQMVYDIDKKRWLNPDQERRMSDLQDEHGSAWASAYYG